MQGIGGLGEASRLHHPYERLHGVETIHNLPPADVGLFGFYKQ
jgi:hypothetical protein